MTITSTAVLSGPYYPNGTATTFPFTFKAFDATDLRVFNRTPTGDVDYDPALYAATLGDSSGSVVFKVPPSSGDVLYIELDLDFTNDISFASEEAFYPQAHNEGFDRAALRDQMLLGKITDLAQPASDQVLAMALAALGAGNVTFDLPDVADGNLPPPAGSNKLYLAGGVLQVANGTMSGASNVASSPLSAVAALLAAGSHLTLRPARYLIDSNLTLAADVFMMPGAQFYVAAGATLKLTGAFSAAITQVFAGPGAVNLTDAKFETARAEWFGVVTNDGAADNRPALQAAVIAADVTQLSSLDYWTASKWTINTSYRRVGGRVRPSHYDTHCGTRVISRDGASPAIQVGPDTTTDVNPSDFTTNVTVEKLAAVIVGAAPPPLNQPTSGVAGFDLRFQKTFLVEDCLAAEMFIGFRCYALVGSRLNRCSAFRSASTGTPNDSWIGFYLQGTPAILAGGNASLYLTGCSATVGGAPALPNGSFGLLLDNAFTDVFVTEFETSNCRVGIAVFGDDFNGTAASTQGDLRISDAVLDTCGQYILWIRQTNRCSMIRIRDIYGGILPGGTAGLQFEQTSGLIVVVGGALIGSGDCPAIHLSDAHGVYVRGLMATDFGGPTMLLESSSDFDLEMEAGNVNNHADNGGVLQPLCLLDNCSNGRVAPIAKGAAAVFADGIRVNANCANITIDASLIETGTLPAGRAKIYIAGVPVTATGWYKPDGSGASTDPATAIKVTGV